METKALTLAAVFMIVIATALCEDATICPAGETPTCQINTGTRFRAQIEKYPHPNSCKWYFLCSNGVAHCVQCGDGLYYDPGTERCDTAVPVGCEDEGVTEGTTTPEESTPNLTGTTPTFPTEEPATTPPGECPGDNQPSVPQCPVCECDGNTFKHPYDCEWYYECEINVPVLKHCEGGFHWNDQLKVCDYPCLAGCNDTSPEPSAEPSTEPTPVPSTTAPSTAAQSTAAQTTPQPSPETTPQQATTTSPVDPPSECPDAPNPDCPDVDPSMAVFFPHPTSCSYYFECTNNVAKCMPCPAGLYFNTAIDDCDYPEDSGCTAGP